MKKILYVLAFCLVFVSCSKDDDFSKENDMVTISFNQQLVSSNSMTRSEGNEFLDIIEEQTPDYVNVTLKNLDLNKTYTCKSNETITIPVGNYEISGVVSSQYRTSNAQGNECKLAITPSLKCNTFTQEIGTNTNKVVLNTYYTCYVVFALIDECIDCKYRATIGIDLSLEKYGKYYFGYFNNNEKFTLIPYDDSTEFITTTYNFSTTYDVNKVYAEYGKYYVIHPQQVDKVTSSFTMQLPNMVEGEI